MLALAEVRPVALAIPAHGRAIEIAMRLLPQVHVIDRAIRMLAELCIKRLHLIRRALRAARGAKRVEAFPRRLVRSIELILLIRRLERALRRAEIARQLLALAVDAPDKAFEVLRLFLLHEVPWLRRCFRRQRCRRISLRHPETCCQQGSAADHFFRTISHDYPSLKNDKSSIRIST